MYSLEGHEDREKLTHRQLAGAVQALDLVYPVADVVQQLVKPFFADDLLGSVENMGSQPSTNGTVKGDGWFQFSFQEAEQPEHPYGQEETSFGEGTYRSHWAVGGRCLKLP